MTLLPSQYVNGFINSHSEGSQRRASMLSTCSVRALGSLAPALGAARPGIQMKVWGAKGRRAQLDRRPSQYWCQPWCGVWRCMHRPDEISKMHETRATDIPRDHLHLHLWVTRGRPQSSSLPIARRVFDCNTYLCFIILTSIFLFLHIITYLLL